MVDAQVYPVAIRGKAAQEGCVRHIHRNDKLRGKVQGGNPLGQVLIPAGKRVAAQDPGPFA